MNSLVRFARRGRRVLLAAMPAALPMNRRRQRVRLDPGKAHFGAEAYPLDKINSVDVYERRRNPAAWIAFGVLGIILFGLGITMPDLTRVVLGLTSGTITIFCALLLYDVSPFSYHLVLHTPEGDVWVMQSEDHEFAENVRAALEGHVAEFRSLAGLEKHG